MNFFSPIKKEISNCDNFADPLDVLECSRLNENIKINRDKELTVYIFIIATALIPLIVCLSYKLYILYIRFNERKSNRDNYYDENILFFKQDTNF